MFPISGLPSCLTKAPPSSGQKYHISFGIDTTSWLLHNSGHSQERELMETGPFPGLERGAPIHCSWTRGTTCLQGFCGGLSHILHERKLLTHQLHSSKDMAGAGVSADLDLRMRRKGQKWKSLHCGLTPFSDRLLLTLCCYLPCVQQISLSGVLVVW